MLSIMMMKKVIKKQNRKILKYIIRHKQENTAVKQLTVAVYLSGK